MKLVFICIICRQITQITCPLIQITARFVGRIRVLTLQHTLLGHKNFCFRLVVYKQTHTHEIHCVCKINYNKKISRKSPNDHFTSKPLFSVQKAREPYRWVCSRESVTWNFTILPTSPYQQFTLGTFYMPVCFRWEAWTIRTPRKYFVKVNMIKQSA